MPVPNPSTRPSLKFSLPPDELKAMFQAGLAIVEAQDAAKAAKNGTKRTMTPPENFLLPQGERLKEAFAAGLAIAEAQRQAREAQQAPPSSDGENKG